MFLYIKYKFKQKRVVFKLFREVPSTALRSVYLTKDKINFVTYCAEFKFLKSLFKVLL